MKGTAPKTEGHYPDYQFPPPPKFRLEEVNQEIRNRQLEMVDSYNSLHQDVNMVLTLKGASQFTNRSDDVREKLLSASGKLNGTRAEVVRALAHIIRLYPRGRYTPQPHRAPIPANDAQIRLPGDQAGLLHPQGEQADIRPLGGQQARTLGHQRWVQEQVHLIREGQTDLTWERAHARHAQLQAQQPRQVQQQLLQPPLPVQEQPQAQPLARPVQEPVRPAPVQEPVRPAPVQEPVRRTGNKRGRDDTSSSSGNRRRGR